MSFVLSIAPALAPAHAADPLWGGETPQQHDARMAWWREARFGMFIHWGLFAIPAGQWNGKAVPGHSEWLMNKAAVPVADYARLAGRFNPEKFDADAWVRTARDAGMKYIVITAKHHDGFAMFASQASTFNIRDATPFRRDPVAELAAAARRQHIKFGVYYSQSQDWHHPGGAGNSWDASQQGDYDAYLERIAVPQVKELLQGYGPIAVLWYDTPRHMTDQRAQRFLPLHALQPGLIVNNRLRTPDPRDGSTRGDTETPEQFIPPNGYPGKDWETCMTMNDSWGFKAADQNWKSSDELIRKLSDIASKGGNFLLNVGPTALGEIPAPCVDRLHVVGAWLQRNGAAIYGTQAGPFPRTLPWGRTTRNGNIIYLHVWDWPADDRVLLPGVHQRPRNAATEATPDGLIVRLSRQAKDAPLSIVPLEFDRPVTTTQSLATVDSGSRITLPAAEAIVSGGTTSGEVIRVVTQWKLQYVFTTPAPGLWRIAAEVSPSAYNRISVAAPGPFGRSVTAAVQAFGRGAGDFVNVELGYLALPAGPQGLEFKSEMDDLRPLEIRRVWLTPVK